MKESLNITLDWYLRCTYSFSDKSIKRIKEGVKKFMVGREKNDLNNNFINWKRKDNEIAVWTSYAYADLSIPKQFNLIFQLDNTNNFVETEYKITHVLLNGWTSINEIAKGHQHVAIMEFTKAIPDIFNLLSDFDDYGNDKKQVQLAFCDKENFEDIKTKMKQLSV